jgi:hypothetical protein
MACDPQPVWTNPPDTIQNYTSVTSFRFTGYTSAGYTSAGYTSAGYTSAGCTSGAGVLHFRINEGGHTWPGAAFNRSQSSRVSTS